MAGTTKRVARKRRAAYTKFKAWMAENDVKQRHLAELLGVSVAAVNARLNGAKGDFSMADVRKICEYYKISADNYFVQQKVS